MAVQRSIELEGVRVNNLQNISLKIRHNALTVICGVSGSGKSSLAFDTLYAEGQRRYVETFSPSSRQFLDRVEHPDADRISGLPPAIAIRQQMRFDGQRSTLGTRTEIIAPLRVLFARAGRQVCPDCQQSVEAMSADSIATQILLKKSPARLLIATEVPVTPESYADVQQELILNGLTRGIFQGKSVRLEELKVPSDIPSQKARRKTGRMPMDGANHLIVIVDRVKSDSVAAERLSESISTAMKIGNGQCVVLSDDVATFVGSSLDVDGVKWSTEKFSGKRECSSCGRVFPEPTPESLSFTSPVGACPDCGGTGVTRIPRGSIENRRPRSKPSADDEKQCTGCNGLRLNRDAEAIQLAGLTLSAAAAMEIGELSQWLATAFASLTSEMQSALKSVYEHAERRIAFIIECGMSYLSLDRSMKTLSGGESQRAALTSALCSGLVNTLYVLDEPTSGLHPTETNKIISAVRKLQRSGNTVVVVEHDPDFIRAADEIIEIGPDAGAAGGRVVFQGTPNDFVSIETATSLQLANVDSKPPMLPSARRREAENWLTLTNVRCHNIQDLSIKVPLGVLCAVTGVSGSGKSSLIVDSLYPELCRRLDLPTNPGGSGTISRIAGAEHLVNVVLLDQSPVKRSRRSVPAMWIGVFNEIRVLLAETHEAKKRNYKRGMFSFNLASGGRCPVCEGRGIVTVAMQFLADIQTVCEECSGRRFRPDILEVRYRDRSVNDILCMTGEEAFAFFNGHHKIQQRLNALRQVGLGYLQLGQPLSTISGGEAQRLRIAALIAGIPMQEGDTAASNRSAAAVTRSGRTLFLLDEPSTGLHVQDISRLHNCIDFLLQTGHSVIVIDHDEAIISQADYIITLGPGPGKHGGQSV